VGASGYVLRDGDIINWKFEKSKFWEVWGISF
jgi:hypothetical protein